MAIEKTRVRISEVRARVQVPKIFKSKKGTLTFSNRSNFFYADIFLDFEKPKLKVQNRVMYSVGLFVSALCLSLQS